MFQSYFGVPTAWMPSKKTDCNCSAQEVLISRSIFSPSKSLLEIQLCRRRVQKECLIRCSPHSGRVYIIYNWSRRIQDVTANHIITCQNIIYQNNQVFWRWYMPQNHENRARHWDSSSSLKPPSTNWGNLCNNTRIQLFMQKHGE